MVKSEDKKRNKLTAKEYKVIFSKEFKDNNTFYTRDGADKVKVLPGEKWYQCYDESSVSRSKLPKYLFILEHHDLLALNPSGKNGIHLIRKYDCGGYWQYGISREDGKTLTIYLHQLVVIIRGGKFFGNAKQVLEEQGLEAFGNRPGKLQIHHIDGDKKNNHPSNLLVLSFEIHQLIQSKFPQNVVHSEKRARNIEEICKQLEKESITEPVLVVAGQKYEKTTCEYLGDNKFRDIETVEKMAFSKEGIESLACMLERLNWSSMLNISENSKTSEQEVDKCQ